VNAASVDSGPVTTYTYDPSGVASVSGAANSFPFLYQGMEHEVTDPGNLYFDGSGNMHNPQIWREVSPVGEQGIGGPPDGDGFGGFGPGHHGGGHQSGMSVWQDLNEGLSILDDAFMFQGGAGGEGGEGINFSIPSGWFTDIWDDLFGSGNSAPPIPRQMRHHKHPIYDILGISADLTPTQAPAKCDCPTAPVLPRSSVDDNIRATQAHGSGWYGRAWWLNKVRPYGDWAYNYDYPGAWRKWDDAGNFNYGATGRACGYSADTLVAEGANLQNWEGTSQGGANSKAKAIRDGERYYDCGCYK
jgi:hypothetical protein